MKAVLSGSITSGAPFAPQRPQSSPSRSDPQSRPELTPAAMSHELSFADAPPAVS